jgi:hypothetical protein
MNRPILLAALLAVACAPLAGCLRAPVMPPAGLVVTAYSAPLDYAQERSPVSTKQGEASTFAVLGLLALGDASIQTAARQGGLTEIHGADYRYFSILGIYQRYTTVVHGE